jgi:hypothetical protein
MGERLAGAVSSPALMLTRAPRTRSDRSSLARKARPPLAEGALPLRKARRGANRIGKSAPFSREATVPGPSMRTAPPLPHRVPGVGNFAAAPGGTMEPSPVFETTDADTCSRGCRCTGNGSPTPKTRIRARSLKGELAVAPGSGEERVYHPGQVETCIRARAGIGWAATTSWPRSPGRARSRSAYVLGTGRQRLVSVR